MDNDRFDDFIKRNLDGLNSEDVQHDWNSFEQKLDNSIEESTLNDNDFDSLIRDKMDGLSVSSSLSDWNTFEEKMNESTPKEDTATILSDEQIDKIAKSQLQNINIPFNPNHWTLMSNRLEEEFSIKRKIVKYKIVECLLILLVVLTTVQYSSLNKVYKNTELTDSIQPVFSFEEKKQTDKTAILSDISTNQQKETTNTLNTAKRKEKISKDVDKELDNSSAGNSIPPRINDEGNYIHTTSGNHSSLAKESASISVTSKTIISSIVLEEEALLGQKGLAPLPVKKLPIAKTILKNKEKEKVLPLLSVKHKTALQIGTVTAFNYNHISTANALHFGKKIINKYSTGYSGGIIFNLDYKKATLSSGIVYRQMSYLPQQTTTIDGSFAEGYRSHTLDKININLVEIPLNFHFKLNKVDRAWGIYAITGSSLNILSITNYNISIRDLNNGANLLSPPNDGIENSDATEELYTESRRSGTGFLEGGTFGQNSYLTANIGVGIERTIANRWTLFVNPIYQYEAFGKRLGIKKMRVHTFSAQLGVKARFK